MRRNKEVFAEQTLGYEVTKVPDPRFGQINVYPADVLSVLFEPDGKA